MLNNGNIQLSRKQIEFIKNANKRWNGKIGATRCGKTYLDFIYVIPSRLLERKGKQGLNFILGVSKSTIERNILEPMRKHWGDKLVGVINSENICKIFGEKVYCLGAEKISQMSKLRGAEAKYIYWDELVDCNEEVFQLAKSRLSLPYSVCDFTGNPTTPTNFVKKFIDETSPEYIYTQNWTIYDNPFLPKGFVKALEEEYSGTIYYDRYILGRWVAAEGAIYPLLSKREEDYVIDRIPANEKIIALNTGIDFGGSKSSTAFVTCAIGRNYENFYFIESKKIDSSILDTEILKKEFKKYIEYVYNKYGMYQSVFPDNAEPLHIRDLQNEQMMSGLPCKVQGALKEEITYRIQAFNTLFSQKRIKFLSHNQDLIKAFKDAVWDEKSTASGKDIRLDYGSYCVDLLDASEYAIERLIDVIYRTGGMM